MEQGRAVETLKEAGYSIKDACNALGISKSGYFAAKHPKKRIESITEAKNTGLIEKIKAIKLEHPFWDTEE